MRPIITVIASLMWIGSAVADTIHVPGDYPTIQGAVDASSDGDEIIVAPGTYTSNHPSQVVHMKGKAVTLRARESSGQQEVIIDGEEMRRGIVCNSGETAETVISGFTIKRGHTYFDGAGIFCRGSSPTITDCILSNNIAGDRGGGICCELNASPTITDCTITGNTAHDFSGGGICCKPNSSPSISGCLFSGNTSRQGGGIFCDLNVQLTMTDCTFLLNTASLHHGGGICCYQSSPTITDCMLARNTAAEEGGGLYCHQSSPAITNCTFQRNTAWLGGGVRCSAQSNPMISGCLLSNNTAVEFGGGVSSDKSRPSLFDTSLCGNVPDQTDGPWADDGSNSVMSQCCAGDVTFDGVIDVYDILSVIEAWGDCDGSGAPLGGGDSVQDSILDRAMDSDVRVVTWNVPDFEPSAGGDNLVRHARVLKAIDPDVIVLQEVSAAAAAVLPGWLNDHVRPADWQLYVGLATRPHRTIIASVYPLDMRRQNTDPEAWTGRGVTIARVRCPAPNWTTDLYLLAVHMKAGSGDSDQLYRQDTADAIANWLGDARTEGEVIDDLPQNTPMVVLGDMNLYSEDNQAGLTMLTGDIIQENEFGDDIKGDWDETDLVDPMPVDLITGDTFTILGWKSRTDRFMVTDSVVHLGTSFVLNTMTLATDPYQLHINGLIADDTTVAMTSDHLPVVLDFRDPNTCFHDLDHDGIVGANDLLAVLAAWGFCVAH